jgi:mannosyl-glycoprotein endo-beta-N-acetylglucosaminidase
MTVSVAPIAVTDRIWYGVHSSSTGGGWVEEGHLRAGASGTPAGPVTAVGQQFQVTEALNMRSGAGTNFGIIATLPAGTTGSVIGGPSNASGYTWWQVRTAAGSTGWVVTNWIVRLSSSTPGNPTGFGKGVGVRTSIAVNLRRDAGTNYPIVATLSSNTNATITDGPRVATGYTWWKLRTTAGQEGWAVQDYLVRTSGPGEPLPEPQPIRLALGDDFRVTSAAALRTAAGPSNPVVRTLSVGTTGAIIGGPLRRGGGFVWYQVSTGTGITGWIMQDDIVKVASLPNPESTIRFQSGDNFQVSATLNLRSAAGLWNSILMTLPIGTTGTIRSVPWRRSGYIWYQVRTSGGVVGWVIQDYLEETAGPVEPSPTPNYGFAAGDRFEVTAAVNVRSAAGLWNNIVTTLPVGAVGTVVGGPMRRSEYVWWQVQTTSGSGWLVQNWIRKI